MLDWVLLIKRAALESKGVTPREDVHTYYPPMTRPVRCATLVPSSKNQTIEIGCALLLPKFYRCNNLLIQWIQQNRGRVPKRRKNAPELILLKPEQLEGIEVTVAKAFGP